MAFCLGLILVVAGAELFTVNNLIVMTCVDGKVTLRQLPNIWGLIYQGNIVGDRVFFGLFYWFIYPRK